MLETIADLNREIRLRSLLALFWFCAFALPLLAQAPPSQDTFVSAGKPTTNYGVNPSLAVQSGNGGNTLLQFNLASLPTGVNSSQVNNAKLRLFVSGFTTAGSFDIYLINGKWSENTVTYATAPPLGGLVTGGVGVPSTAKNTFIEVDVTSALQQWVSSPQTNFGLALVPSPFSQISVTFDSKEDSTISHEAALLYSFNGPAGPQGLPGPQGIQGIQGPQGLIGPMGLTGVQGLQGTTGQGFNFRAAFDPAATYAAYDVVTLSGSSYVAKSATHPGDPAPDTNSNWSLFAQQGATGQRGPTGQQGPQGDQGIQGPRGFAGATGLPGAPGAPGPAGPQGPGSFTGTQEFTNPGNLTNLPQIWIPAAGVTHVLVEMWGGGGAGGFDPTVPATGGGGGAYSRTVANVTPLTVYTIQVGSGGQAADLIHSIHAQPGEDSSMVAADGTLILFAGGGNPGILFLLGTSVSGGSADVGPGIIGRDGGQGTLTGGGLAWGASFSLNGGQTGRGGDPNQTGQPGYVLLTW